LAFHGKYRPILYYVREIEILVKIAIFHESSQNIAIKFGMKKKTEFCGYRMMKTFEDVCLVVST